MANPELNEVPDLLKQVIKRGERGSLQTQVLAARGKLLVYDTEQLKVIVNKFEQNSAEILELIEQVAQNNNQPKPEDPS